ncbi:lysozyme C, milk isozyme-like [Latimeria chalumnae]|uniref:lysozyme C, milk isozyme-like n=1 Tax=Latimeria chalumnae TaxID=7897 RepID=UPI00313F3A4F
MKALLIPLLLLVVPASGMVYSRCELARVLQNAGMNGYWGYSLGNWLCMSYYESGYNTQAIDHDSNGSTDYGIFQINSYWWCYDGTPGGKNACNIRCSQLLDNDISDDIACAKRVVRDPLHMKAWYGWRYHCEGRNLDGWVVGCDL